MSKKSRFRGPFKKQHGKLAQLLFKSASQHLYDFQWSLTGQLSCKRSLFLPWKILGLLVNTLAADEMYPVLNRDNLTIQFKWYYLEKRKIFLNFLLHFWNLNSILNILEKKMTLTAFVFPKLRTLKTYLDKCLKSQVWEDPSTSTLVTFPSTVLICITSPLSYLSITLKSIELEKVSLIDMPNLGTTC